MKKVFLFSLFVDIVVMFMSCARGISPYEAANGKARCGRYIR